MRSGLEFCLTKITKNIPFYRYGLRFFRCFTYLAKISILKHGRHQDKGGTFSSNVPNPLHFNEA